MNDQSILYDKTKREILPRFKEPKSSCPVTPQPGPGASTSTGGGEKPRTSKNNICDDEYRHYLSCGGGEVIYDHDSIVLEGVLNCVYGRFFLIVSYLQISY